MARVISLRAALDQSANAMLKGGGGEAVVILALGANCALLPLWGARDFRVVCEVQLSRETQTAS